MKTAKKRAGLFLILLVIFFQVRAHIETPANIRNTACVYTGICERVYHYEHESGRFHGTITYSVLHMEDGTEFWVNDTFRSPDLFDESKFEQAMGKDIVTILYNPHRNMNLGSLAKEAVDIRIGTRVFLSIEVVENGYHTSRMVTNFVSFTVLIPFYIELWDYFRAKKRSYHTQKRKAKRREWLDAHPEEKGAPPSAKRKKDR